MKNILLTGATGNVSQSVVKLVSDWAKEDVSWILAVRSPQKLEKGISDRFEVRTFDFEDEQTYAPAFFEIDVLFLLRPPHIADVEGVFRPVLAVAKKEWCKKGGVSVCSGGR